MNPSRVLCKINVTAWISLHTFVDYIQSQIIFQFKTYTFISSKNKFAIKYKWNEFTVVEITIMYWKLSEALIDLTHGLHVTVMSEHCF